MPPQQVPEERGGDLAALFEALDSARLRRGLTWRELTSEVNALFSASGARPISQSTITRLRRARVAEGDGVLQLFRWLGCSPEDLAGESRDDARLPNATPQHVLRFDTKRLHAALEARRAELGLTWARLAAQIGLNAAALTRLANGGRTTYPGVLRISKWLAQPTSAFIRLSTR